MTVRYTFLGDGSSDRALMNVINWAIRDHYPTLEFSPSFAVFTFEVKPLKELSERMLHAVDLYPCDLLFVHRDGEDIRRPAEILQQRHKEIGNAAQNLNCPYVAIVPIKMMETWLLTDAQAIKKAAGNTNRNTALKLPSLKALEQETKPKELLHELIREASNLKGRHLRNLNVHKAVHLVAEYTRDFRALRYLTAYRSFEADMFEKIDLILNKRNML